jgi:hypothetical protein
MPPVVITIEADAQQALRILNQVQGTVSGVGDASQEAQRKQGGWQQAAQNFHNLSQSALNAVSMIQGVAGAIEDVVSEGFSIQRSQKAFETYTDLIGVDAVKAFDKLKAATAGMVSDFDLTTAGTRFFSMGLAESADEAGRLAEIAVTLGSALGTGPTQSMEDFALLLANESIPRLDTFGISSSRVRTKIDELLASGEALTRSEAFKMAVMDEAAVKVEALGGAAGVAGGGFERLKVGVENALNDAKSAVAGAVDEISGGIANILFGGGDEGPSAHDVAINVHSLVDSEQSDAAGIAILDAMADGTLSPTQALTLSANVRVDVSEEMEGVAATQIFDMLANGTISESEALELAANLGVELVGFDDLADAVTVKLRDAGLPTADILTVLTGGAEGALKTQAEDILTEAGLPPAQIAIALSGHAMGAEGITSSVADLRAQAGAALEAANLPPAKIAMILSGGVEGELKWQANDILASAGFEPAEQILALRGPDEGPSLHDQALSILSEGGIPPAEIGIVLTGAAEDAKSLNEQATDILEAGGLPPAEVVIALSGMGDDPLKDQAATILSEAGLPDASIDLLLSGAASTEAGALSEQARKLLEGADLPAASIEMILSGGATEEGDASALHGQAVALLEEAGLPRATIAAALAADEEDPIYDQAVKILEASGMPTADIAIAMQGIDNLEAVNAGLAEAAALAAEIERASGGIGSALGLTDASRTTQEIAQMFTVGGDEADAYNNAAGVLLGTMDVGTMQLEAFADALKAQAEAGEISATQYAMLVEDVDAFIKQMPEQRQLIDSLNIAMQSLGENDLSAVLEQFEQLTSGDFSTLGEGQKPLAPDPLGINDSTAAAAELGAALAEVFATAQADAVGLNETLALPVTKVVTVDVVETGGGIEVYGQ